MIAQGFLRILSFFDIAEAIEMEKLYAILGSEAAPRTQAFSRRSPEYAQTQHAPIVESVEPVALSTGEKLEARIKYYWFGVVAVELITGFKCDFDSLCPQTYRWMNAPEGEEAAEALLRSRLDRFRPALIKPSQKCLDEDYPVIDIESAQHPDPRADLVRGQVLPLSVAERNEVVGSALSYHPTDLVVVGWAAALVYDKPDPTSAVIDLLEYANTQLLEFRYYDELLTNLLSNVYSSLEGHESFLASWRLARRAGLLNRLRLDIMDLAERTEYAGKFISDTFYARVYRVSSARIGVNDYKTLVDEKLKTAGELYDFMVKEFNERRMFVVEVVVAVLVLL